MRWRWTHSQMEKILQPVLCLSYCLLLIAKRLRMGLLAAGCQRGAAHPAYLIRHALNSG